MQIVPHKENAVDLQNRPGFKRYRHIGEDRERDLYWPENVAGPFAYEDDELLAIASDLLNDQLETDHRSFEDILALAGKRLKSVEGKESEFVTQTGRKTIYMHDGTEQNGNYHTDLRDALENDGRNQALAAYTNIRAASFAGPEDMVVSNQPSLKDKRDKDAADGDLNRPEYILTEDTSQYYLSHTLLTLAQQYKADQAAGEKDTQDPLKKIIAAFVDFDNQDNSPVVSLYTLDKPFQIFLIWLHEEVNRQRVLKEMEPLTHIEIQANAPEDSANYNQKASLHPNIDMLEPNDAAEVLFGNLLTDLDGFDSADNAVERLRRESLFSPFGLMLMRNVDPQSPLSLDGLDNDQANILVETIKTNKKLNWISGPGYAVSWDENDNQKFFADISKAAARLKKLYGTSEVRIKHNRSSDGDGVSSAINIDDLLGGSDQAGRDAMAELFEAGIFKGGSFQDIVIEGNVYPTQDGGKLESGSVHVIGGKAPKYVSKELTAPNDSTKWVGNLIVANAKAEKDLGFSKNVVKSVNGCMAELARSMDKLPESSRLTMAGFDFLVGMLGGFFGDQELAIIADPNIRFTGAMPIIAQLEKVIQLNATGQKHYAAEAIAGMNVPLAEGINYSQLKDAVKAAGIDIEDGDAHLGIIFFTGTSVMLSATGKSLEDAQSQLKNLMEALRAQKLLAN